MRKPVRLLVVLLALIPNAVFSANLIVPSLELITRGYVANSGDFVLGTKGGMQFLIEGGYKFGGRILLGYESADLESLADKNVLFQGASVAMISPFGFPLDITYFTGETDTFGTGDIFPAYYGTDPIASRFRGFLYFPEAEQIRYNGIHTVKGTGLKISSDFKSEWARAAIYAYQDQYLGTGTYSGDIHGSLNLPNFKVESFFGVTYPVTSAWYTYYRAGLLLFYDTTKGGEFLAQIGIPRWNPSDSQEALSINQFYFLFEPRVRFGIFSIILTLFWHPKYYLQAETGELGSADINANFSFGDPALNPVSGGVEAKLAFSSATGTDPFSAIVSPYFSTITSGVSWNFKLNVKLFPFSMSDIVEGFIGIRAEF